MAIPNVRTITLGDSKRGITCKDGTVIRIPGKFIVAADPYTKGMDPKGRPILEYGRVQLLNPETGQHFTWQKWDETTASWSGLPEGDKLFTPPHIHFLLCLLDMHSEPCERADCPCPRCKSNKAPQDNQKFNVAQILGH